MDSIAHVPNAYEVQSFGIGHVWHRVLSLADFDLRLLAKSMCMSGSPAFDQPDSYYSLNPGFPTAVAYWRIDGAIAPPES